jgi:guanosine-3',5'-bis(diphosphate) 3'-pyrophosphohydrolase
MTTDNSLFSPVVERAMRWAARSHRNHQRKASDLPYLSHPASVAMILLRVGLSDDEVLAAALLHDVVEDTDCSLETLAEHFSPRVVELVAALTERKRDADGRKRSWTERKTEHIEHIAAAPFEARAIALADKLHNLGSMLFDLDSGEELWSRFGATPDQIIWYHRAIVTAATQDDPRLVTLAEYCRLLIDRLEAVAS